MATISNINISGSAEANFQLDKRKLEKFTIFANKFGDKRLMIVDDDALMRDINSYLIRKRPDLAELPTPFSVICVKEECADKVYRFFNETAKKELEGIDE